MTDEFMRDMLAKTREYCVVILKAGPKRDQPDLKKIIWEHGRRNFQLRAEGKLAVVCPVNDGTDVKGLGIFTTGVEETRRVMDGDPSVQAGVLTYEVHPCRSFPGDALPG